MHTEKGPGAIPVSVTYFHLFYSFEGLDMRIQPCVPRFHFTLAFCQAILFIGCVEYSVAKYQVILNYGDDGTHVELETLLSTQIEVNWKQIKDVILEKQIFIQRHLCYCHFI